MLAIQAEEGEGSGHPSEPQPPPSTAQSIHEEPIHNVTSEPIPNVADEAVYEEWDNGVEMDITTASLDTAHASGNITKTQSTPIPNVPLLKELVQVVVPGAKKPRGVPLLRLDRVLALEINLRQTKKVYGAAYTKLIMKVKKLEKTGRMIEEIDQDAGVTLVTPTHSQEDQPEDQLGVFSAAKVLADEAKNVRTYTRRRRAVSTGSGGVSTASRLFSTTEESVSTAGASMPASTVSLLVLLVM
ncbi:hypothetical protein Tco_1039962 [Tanacetum coccineum]